VHGRRGDDAGGGRRRQGAVAVEVGMGARGGQGVVRGGGGGGEKRPKRKEQDEEEGHAERSHSGIRGKAESRWMAGCRNGGDWCFLWPERNGRRSCDGAVPVMLLSKCAQ
jgi:hypothetical protein